jgi:hypothetical protein
LFTCEGKQVPTLMESLLVMEIPGPKPIKQ